MVLTERFYLRKKQGAVADGVLRRSLTRCSKGSSDSVGFEVVVTVVVRLLTETIL